MPNAILGLHNPPKARSFNGSVAAAYARIKSNVNRVLAIRMPREIGIASVWKRFCPGIPIDYHYRNPSRHFSALELRVGLTYSFTVSYGGAKPGNIATTAQLWQHDCVLCPKG
jgi:hypothetical protein